MGMDVRMHVLKSSRKKKECTWLSSSDWIEKATYHKDWFGTILGLKGVPWFGTTHVAISHKKKKRKGTHHWLPLIGLKKANHYQDWGRSLGQCWAQRESLSFWLPLLVATDDPITHLVHSTLDRWCKMTQRFIVHTINSDLDHVEATRRNTKELAFSFIDGQIDAKLS